MSLVGSWNLDLSLKGCVLSTRARAGRINEVQSLRAAELRSGIPRSFVLTLQSLWKLILVVSIVLLLDETGPGASFTLFVATALIKGLVPMG